MSACFNSRSSIAKISRSSGGQLYTFGDNPIGIINADGRIAYIYSGTMGHDSQINVNA
jgi:hypothetical protein